MVNKLFGSTLMEQAPLTMGADTDNVHIIDLVIMNNTILNILIID